MAAAGAAEVADGDGGGLRLGGPGLVGLCAAAAVCGLLGGGGLLGHAGSWRRGLLGDRLLGAAGAAACAGRVSAPHAAPSQ